MTHSTKVKVAKVAGTFHVPSTRNKVVGTFHVPSTWNLDESSTANGTAERARTFCRQCRNAQCRNA
jgi:hypothetical protein